MELSEDQKRLIALLKTLGLQEEGIIMTMLAVKEPEKTEKLIDYIIEMWDKNFKLDKDKIVIRALEISQED